jgi:hypothetical protein
MRRVPATRMFCHALDPMGERAQFAPDRRGQVRSNGNITRLQARDVPGELLERFQRV